MSTPIGFIGLGLMGKPMAPTSSSRASPSSSTAVARPRRRARGGGRERAESPAEVALRAARSSSRCCRTPPDVVQVLEGRNGVFPALQPGTIIIDIEQHRTGRDPPPGGGALARGALLLDAPVSGGEIGAIDGTLSIMVGGDADGLRRVKPILDAMGNPETDHPHRRRGRGTALQGLQSDGHRRHAGRRQRGVRAGAEERASMPPKVREALLGGFAASRVLEVHGERILNGNYKPGFRAQLYAKDLPHRVGRPSPKPASPRRSAPWSQQEI